MSNAKKLSIKFNSSKTQKIFIICLFLIIPLSLLFIFTYLPFGEMICYSFYKMKYIGSRTFVGLKNYKELFSRSDIFNSLKISLYYIIKSLIMIIQRI